MYCAWSSGGGGLAICKGVKYTHSFRRNGARGAKYVLWKARSSSLVSRITSLSSTMSATNEQ